MALAGMVPLYAQASRQQALQLEQQGNNVEAEKAWRSIAAANPQNAEAFAHLGLIEARKGRVVLTKRGKVLADTVAAELA